MSVIALDFGHGDKDPGCVYGDLTEKNYVLAFGLKLAAVLRANGHTVVLTRGEDIDPTFAQRAETAHGSRADVLISLHVNANKDPSIRGLRCYYRDTDTQAQELGDLVCGFAPDELARRGRRAVTTDHGGPGALVVLRRYKCPALLVELGFASNPHDLAYLLKEGTHEVLCTTIDTALSAWL
jgi:N-acetylmuramoyl-L-alanine amidase